MKLRKFISAVLKKINPVEMDVVFIRINGCSLYALESSRIADLVFKHGNYVREIKIFLDFEKLTNRTDRTQKTVKEIFEERKERYKQYHGHDWQGVPIFLCAFENKGSRVFDMYC